MECEKVRKQMSAYQDGELVADDAIMVQSHLSLCADCTKYHNELKEVDPLLRSLKRIEPAPGFAVSLSELVKPSRSPGFLSRAFESTLATLDSFFELAVGPRYRKTATLDEFGDFPPLSISCAYFHVLGQGR